MKILELKLKKDVLIVQPEETGNMNYWVTLHSKDWDFICLGSELTEEIASELVDKSIYTGLYAHYVDKIPVNTYCYNSAIPSFISAVETKGFYWLGNPVKIHTLASENADEYHKKWQEAEEKTFKNPLIFVHL